MPKVSWNVNINSEGATGRRLASPMTSQLEVDWLHELSLKVPASSGRKHGKRTFKLRFDGVAVFASAHATGRVAGEVRIDLKRKGPFELNAPRIYLGADAVSFAAGLASVELSNTSNVPRTVSVVVGMNLPPEKIPRRRKKATKKKGAKKTDAKKTGAKKTGAKKTGAKKTGAKKTGAKKTGAKKTGAE